MTGARALTTPKGNPARMHVRDGTSDLSIVNATFINDEYDLASLPELEGWALDVGAHIGSVTIPLAIDHPALQVIAIEAVPANCDVLWQNVVENQLQDRVHLYRVALSDHFGTAKVWSEYTHAEGLDDDYVRTNRFVGNVFRQPVHDSWDGRQENVRALRLSDVLEQMDDVSWMKIDCEGCEWDGLADPAIVKVRSIIGEYHDRTEDELAAVLLPTHDVTTFPAGAGLGIFHAERRD